MPPRHQHGARGQNRRISTKATRQWCRGSGPRRGTTSIIAVRLPRVRQPGALTQHRSVRRMTGCPLAAVPSDFVLCGWGSGSADGVVQRHGVSHALQRDGPKRLVAEVVAAGPGRGLLADDHLAGLGERGDPGGQVAPSPRRRRRPGRRPGRCGSRHGRPAGRPRGRARPCRARRRRPPGAAGKWNIPPSPSQRTGRPPRRREMSFTSAASRPATWAATSSPRSSVSLV